MFTFLTSLEQITRILDKTFGKNKKIQENWARKFWQFPKMLSLKSSGNFLGNFRLGLY